MCVATVEYKPVVCRYDNIVVYATSQYHRVKLTLYATSELKEKFEMNVLKLCTVHMY